MGHHAARLSLGDFGHFQRQRIKGIAPTTKERNALPSRRRILHYILPHAWSHTIGVRAVVPSACTRGPRRVVAAAAPRRLCRPAREAVCVASPGGSCCAPHLSVQSVGGSPHRHLPLGTRTRASGFTLISPASPRFGIGRACLISPEQRSRISNGNVHRYAPRKAGCCRMP